MIKQNKININKKMLGRKVFVITNYEKFQGSVGVITDIINDNMFKIEYDNIINNVSIFDVRSLPYEF